MVVPLDRKLLRDLWRMKGQVAAIAMVVSVGVLMLVMMDGLVTSLDETKRAYYERYRLADAFAPTKRAPNRLLDEIALIPGVAAVRGRVTGYALVDLPGRALPLRAQAVSLPDFGPPRLNDYLLVAGRPLDPGHADEVLLLHGFAAVHGLSPGDRLVATMNGVRRTLRIVGLAQAPEFLTTVAPGESMPDDSRFAVLWLSRRTMEAAYDLRGAFNEALVSLGRDANPAAVLADLDRKLAPYGGLGAYTRADHLSDRFVREEIDGLRASARTVPPLFLAVAAFLLNIVISRLVQAEREQIGLLMAFGYSAREVAWHYLKFALAVALAGALAGCLFGMMAGRAMTGLYLEYFKFPFLIFQVDPRSFVTGVIVSVLAAAAGGALVLRGVFALTPAVAMRAPAPADFSGAASSASALLGRLDQPSRMVARRLLRQPGRAGVAIAGIAAGMALSVAMLGVLSSFDDATAISFEVLDRGDATVSFIEPVSDKAIYELSRLDGVIAVEPARAVAVQFRHATFTYRGQISGMVPGAQLARALDADMAPITPRRDGLVLAQALADILHVRPGDVLGVEVREGRRPVLTLPVVGVARTMLGAPAYMDLAALNRALGEPGRVGGAHLRLDPAHEATLFRTIKDMPGVIGITLKREARAAFQKVIDTGAGSMRYVMVLVAGIITFGIVFNSARIAFAERARDLASLRVLGFTRAETAFVLLGEFAVIVLAALPAGAWLGRLLAEVIARAFSTDLYQIPATVAPGGYGVAMLAVLAAALVSGWLVKRDIDGIDLVSALKTRE